MTAQTIKITRGNLLSLQRGIMVHGCNCKGSMGAGFAKYLARTYPSVKAAYQRYHRANGLKLGDVVFVRPQTWADEGSGLPLPKQEFARSPELPSRLVIANAMTQYGYGGAKHGNPDIDYEALSRAFEAIRPVAIATGLPVHFPLIGCGLAGGEWKEVGPRIEEALGHQVEKVLVLDDRGARMLGI